MRDGAADLTRDHDRARITAEEAVRRSQWAIEERERMPESGEAAVLRAQLTGELEAERRGLERAERERERRAERIALLEGKIAADRALLPRAEQLTDAAAAMPQPSAGWPWPPSRSSMPIARQARAWPRCCASALSRRPPSSRSSASVATSSRAWEVRKQRAADQRTEAQSQLSVVAEHLGLSAEAREEPLERSAARSSRARPSGWSGVCSSLVR